MDSMQQDMIAQFKAITDCSQSKAEQYLRITDWNIEQSVEFFFNSNGADLETPEASTAHSAPAQDPVSPITRSRGATQANAISVDDDDEYVSPVEDDTAFSNSAQRQTRSSNRQVTRAVGESQGSSRTASNQPSRVPTVEDDEAMARRLQQEMFADEAGAGITTGAGNFDTDAVRAPIAGTTETLVGPEDDLYSSIMSDRRGGGGYRGASRGIGRVGIFNQRPVGSGSIWDEESNESSSTIRQRQLAAATGGASDMSKKANQLAEMFRPPFEIMYRGSFDEARDFARDGEKWILVNIQDAGVFDSQILNRDMWKDVQIKQTVKENFVFCQYQRDSDDGLDYIRLYMAGQYAIDFPHIAIIDPRTGEQLKVWTRVPDKAEFIMQLHEFLDRYSLNQEARNPVQNITKAKVDVDHMTEEEMLDLALRNSLGNAEEDTNGVDPDTLTKSEGKQKDNTNTVDTTSTVINDEDPMDIEDEEAPSTEVAAFNSISSSNHHTEPDAGPTITRVQIKLHDGSRVVRRFALSDPVRTIYEYVKADLLPSRGKDEGEFELRALSKNLIDLLDDTVEQAGLKNGTIMMEMS